MQATVAEPVMYLRWSTGESHVDWKCVPLRLTPERSQELVLAAAKGDRTAWEDLVEAYAGLVWAIIRNHRLGQGDAGDVSQTTWLRLVENIERIQDPSRVGAWLATTTRRECLRVIKQQRRLVLLSSVEHFEPPSGSLPLEQGMVDAERDEAVRAALRQLSPRCQQLLSLLMLDPPPSYEEVSEAMGMPIGSIGPTRGRCLSRLHEILAASGTTERSARSLEM